MTFNENQHQRDKDGKFTNMNTPPAPPAETNNSQQFSDLYEQDIEQITIDPSEADTMSDDDKERVILNSAWRDMPTDEVIQTKTADYERSYNSALLRDKVDASIDRITDSDTNIDPTRDVDSTATIAVGLSYDPKHTVYQSIGKTSTHVTEPEASVEDMVRTGLHSPIQERTSRAAQNMSDVMDSVKDNCADTQGEVSLAQALQSYGYARSGDYRAAHDSAQRALTYAQGSGLQTEQAEYAKQIAQIVCDETRLKV